MSSVGIVNCMWFKLLSITVILSCFAIQFGEAQSCALVKNKNNLLGYDPKDQSKVYEKICQGTCTGSSTCRASAFKQKTVAISKGSSSTRQVNIASACSCTATSGGGSGSCTVNGQVYSNGATVYNNCGDRCVCRNGQVTSCCRQRKSFASMTSADRARFTQAVYDLSKGTGGASSSLRQQYITLVEDHRRNFNSGIHGMDQLLAWHRWYILQIENLMRQIDCRITVPFWKWEADYSNPWGSNIWRSTDGLGGGSNGACVSDGVFRPPFYLAPSAGSNQCLRRDRKGSIPSTSQVANLLNTPASSFSSFFNLIASMHAGVHCSVGGTMCIDQSANAPEFLLHHGNMDRLWATWQAKGTSYQQSYTGAVNNYMTASPLSASVRPRDVLDISNHLGVCVQYVDSSSALMAQALMAVPSEILRTVPQTRPKWLKAARKFWRAMNMTKEEINTMLASVDNSLGVAPPLPTGNVQNDTFALQFGISRIGLEDALDSWAAASNATEQAQIHKTKALLSEIDNQIAFKAFTESQQQEQQGTDSSSSTEAPSDHVDQQGEFHEADHNSNNDDDDDDSSNGLIESIEIDAESSSNLVQP